MAGKALELVVHARRNAAAANGCLFTSLPRVVVTNDR